MATTPVLHREKKKVAKRLAGVTGQPYQTCRQVVDRQLPLAALGDGERQLDALAALLGLPGPAQELVYDLARELDDAVLGPFQRGDPEEVDAFLHARLFAATP